MKIKILVFCFLIFAKCFSQEDAKKEFIKLLNGEVIHVDIKKIRPTYIKARQGPVDKVFKVDQIDRFYSKYYNAIFESHAIGKRKRKKFLGVYRDGEVTVLCELKNLNVTVRNYFYSNDAFYGPSYISFGKHREKTGFWTLEGKTYFRHVSEPDSVIHVANKKELFNCKAYECFPIMIKLLNGLNDMDLNANIRNQTFRDLLVKYNNECEARLRVKEEEKEKEKKQTEK